MDLTRASSGPKPSDAGTQAEPCQHLTLTNRYQEVHVTPRHALRPCAPRVSGDGRKLLCSAVQDCPRKRLSWATRGTQAERCRDPSWARNAWGDAPRAEPRSRLDKPTQPDRGGCARPQTPRPLGAISAAARTTSRGCAAQPASLDYGLADIPALSCCRQPRDRRPLGFPLRATEMTQGSGPNRAPRPPH